MNHMLRRATRAALSSHGRSHRCSLRHSSTALRRTALLSASPSAYVSGVTPDQIANNAALAEWYAANFASWQSDPDCLIVPELAAETLDEEDHDPHAIVLPPELAARNIRPLVAYARLPGKEEGSRNCRRMRNPRQTHSREYFPLVPGILHGSDPTRSILGIDPDSKLLLKTPWFEIQRELDRFHHSFESRVYALTLFDARDCHVDYHKSRQNAPSPRFEVCQSSMTITEIPPPPPPTLPPRTPLLENVLVVPTNLRMHPVEHSAFCLNYHRYHPKKPIRLPIRSVNEEESPAMKRGGFIAYVHRTVECLVEDGVPIPDHVALECSGLRQKDVVRRQRLILPEGVSVCPWVSEDYLVGTVFGAKGGGGAEEKGEEKDKKKKKK
ncbi:hypothetical protein ACHAWX_005638 [Stephanocyclus meneghinianus]